MNQYPPNTPGKSSSDSGQSAALDRWSQRRLQRLNTEQGFREQRQGGQAILSPPAHEASFSNNSSGAPYSQAEPPPQQHNQQAQPHPSQQPTYQSSRTGPASHSNAGLAIQTHPVSSSSRPQNYQIQEHSQAYAQQHQYSPPDSGSQYPSQDNSRPPLNQSRSYGQQQQQAGAEDSSMSSSNNGNLPAPKPLRSGNRQSVHNGLGSREGSGLGVSQSGGQQQGVPAYSASIVPSGGQGQTGQSNSQKQSADVGRITPQPIQPGEEMSEEDIDQLIKDHKELRTSRLPFSSSMESFADMPYRREVHQGQEVLL